MGWNDDPHAHPFLRWVDRNKQAVGAAAVAGVTGLAVLMSTVNFGATQLGDGAPSPWMQGQVRYEQVIEQTAEREPVLQIDGYAIEEGRYSYPGIVMITGDLTTDNFRLKADQIIVTGSVQGSGIVLEAKSGGPGTEAEPRFGNGGIEVDGGLNVTDTRLGMRGTTSITVGDNVTGYQSELKAGEIDLMGYLAGQDFRVNTHDLMIDGPVDGDAITLNTQFGVERSHMEGDIYKVSQGGDIVVHGGIYGDGNRVLGGQVQIDGDIEATNLTIEGYMAEVHEKDVSIVMVPVAVPNGNGGTSIRLQPQTNVDYDPIRLFDNTSGMPAVTITGYVSGENIKIDGNAGVSMAGYDYENVTVTTSFESPVLEQRGLEVSAPRPGASPG
ncbi:MAG: hypothetical protein AAF213_03115 [Pseudomonadota bacterium]